MESAKGKVRAAKQKVEDWNNAIDSWNNKLKRRKEELQREADRSPTCHCPDSKCYMVIWLRVNDNKLRLVSSI